MLAATEVGEISSDDDPAAWAAYRKAKLNMAEREGTGGGKSKMDKVKGEG